MIDAKVLLADLTRLLKRLEDDLRERALSPSSEVPELRGQLQVEWQAARDAERTAETFESWAEQVITQAGVHWLLSCVFLRFIEDNGLVDRPWISGTPQSGRIALARDSHDAYFRAHPHQNDRDFLIASFREAGALPGLPTFFDEAHNPVFRLGISGDAAMAVMQFWQEIAADSGLLVRDFTDPAWNTRFLGDLYQDLSEATRKRYALLQTPEFVEEFILDRTLTPAIREFGFREVRMIDPTCGSGHFLLGGFHRLVNEWARAEPGRNRRDIAQKALDGVAGVDLNPFAVAIARFRLWVAALKVSDVHRLSEAPNFKLNVAIGDSLLHGARFGLTATTGMFEGAEHFAGTGLEHAYASEDLQEVNRILGRQYHAVVGNPPYIVVRDAALNAAYRQIYASCHRQYSLGCPFTERFFQLANTGAAAMGCAGFVGLITTNSFMKREFGSKLIEEVLPRLDLTHVIDTSVASIPGHGTPTVILFGRHRSPVADSVRVVMGIKGEPVPPAEPANGLVWRSIVAQTDLAGSESDFLTVSDVERITLARHPWSIVGGGASELREVIEADRQCLKASGADLGYHVITGEDNCLLLPRATTRRLRLDLVRPIVEGDSIRDWACATSDVVLWPYGATGEDLPADALRSHIDFLWAYRTSLKNRKAFGVPVEERGLRWWDIREVYRSRLRTPFSIAVAFVATNNHFFLENGKRVFKQSAPVIKLGGNATHADYVGMLGLLNSSAACFWLHQVCHNKGGPGGGSSKDEKWHDFFEFASTPLAEFPLVDPLPMAPARRLLALGQEWESLQPLAALKPGAENVLLSRPELEELRRRSALVRQKMIAWQEELDWNCYALYGVLPQGTDRTAVTYLEPPEVACGERAFEIVLARRMSQGKLDTRWFEWLGITPVLDLPPRWPEEYRQVVQRRIDLIESDRNIGLVESMGCKRRWEAPAWDEVERAALRDWLLDRLEAPHLWPAGDGHPPQLTTVNRLADAVLADTDFMQMAGLYAGHSGFDVGQIVAELVAGESVPFLPVLRYADTGLRKRAQWEATWALQRHEDRIDAEVQAEASGWREELQSQAMKRFDNATTPEALAWVEDQLAQEITQQKVERKENEVGKIPVPPKYQSKDFLKADVWRLRGGLDVPKERWVSYPGCERGADGSLPIAWAGWDHLQQAMALASYFIDMKEREGWSPERLQPLLAGLLELVPWLKQWHNQMNPDFGARMGDYYESFVNDEARALQFTLDDLRAWKPTVTAVKRGRKKAA